MIRNIIPSAAFALALLLSLSGCSKEQQPFGGNVAPGPVFEVEARSAGDDVALRYVCYAFRSDHGADDFKLFDLIDPLVSGSELSWTSTDLAGYQFRFLFTALPDGEKALSIVNSSGQGMAPGNSWDGIAINGASFRPPKHCYFGVQNIDGDDLITDHRVTCTLERLVGQMVFDFFKVDATGTARTPIAVDPDVAATVMDRVKRIEVNYTGLNKNLVFDEDFKPVAAPGAVTDTTQVIEPALSGSFTLTLPQPAGSALSSYEYAPGGAVRLNGFYLFPAENVNVKITVTYYDTTPKCGIEGHQHDAGCFDDTRSMILNIPAGDNTAPMPVISNTITRNKAMIRCDRIIDISIGSGTGFDVEWGTK